MLNGDDLSSFLRIYPNVPIIKIDKVEKSEHL
jgi:hypothetical protein